MVTASEDQQGAYETKARDQAALESAAKTHSIVKAKALKRLADLIGFLVLLIGLYFTYEEAKRSNSGQNLSNWSEVTSRMFDVDKTFVEHPEFQKYFYDGKVVSRGDIDYPRAYAISVLELDFLDSVTSRIAYNKGHISDDILQQDAWYHYIDALMRTAPLMCDILLEDPTSYGTEMRRVGILPCKEALRSRQIHSAQLPR